MDIHGCYLPFLFLAALNAYVKPEVVHGQFASCSNEHVVKGQHSENDGGERKILGFLDIIEHLYHNQDHIYPDPCYKRKSNPFLKSHCSLGYLQPSPHKLGSHKVPI